MRHDFFDPHHHDRAPSDDQSMNAEGPIAKARATIRKALHIEPSSSNDAVNEVANQLNESPAFNPRKFLNNARIDHSGMPAKTISFIQGTAHAIADPKAAIRDHATRRTAQKLAKSRPYLSKKADLDFLEAYDDLSRAENNRQAKPDDMETDNADRDISHRTEHIADMERARQEMRVAWVTTRHVHRVRAVDSIYLPSFPDNSYFEEKDVYGQTKFNWAKWVAYKLLHGSYGFTAPYIDDFVEMPFDPDILRKHIERLIIVSAPLQEIILEIRRVYRWENPSRTGRWMVLYFFFWYISHIMTFFYGYIIYSVIMNYYYPRSLEELRESINRTLDRSTTALKIGELMDKHGSNDWLGPLLDELGPYIQLQIADFSSFLESCYNFYHFYSPSTTVHSLCLFVALFFVNALGDSRFALKIFWLILGLVFFVCWPVSSLYPQYRLLVSPFKWALWNVPNHVEWSFGYLQHRSAAATNAILGFNTLDNNEHRKNANKSPDWHDANTDQLDTSSPEPTETDILGEKDILTFPCTFNSTPGYLIISTDGLRFSSQIIKIVPIPFFHRPYSDLVEITKLQTKASVLHPLAKIATSADRLELRFKGREGRATLDEVRKNEKVILLENVRGRDKAFNAIIGFSQLKWQHLQR